MRPGIGAPDAGATVSIVAPVFMADAGKSSCAGAISARAAMAIMEKPDAIVSCGDMRNSLSASMPGHVGLIADIAMQHFLLRTAKSSRPGFACMVCDPYKSTVLTELLT